MPVTYDQSPSNPLVIPELVGRVISYVDAPVDVLHCSCVNSVWSIPALRELYRGSMNDMRFRTPEIGRLNSLFVASRERFARNMGFVKHLTIAPETIATEDHKFVCIEKCRLLRDRRSANLLLRPRGKGPTSLAIPLELIEQDLSPLCDLIIHPDLRFLIIDHMYCDLLRFDSGALHERTSLTRLSKLEALSIHRSEQRLDIEKVCEWLVHCDLKIFQIDGYQEHFEHLAEPHVAQLLRCLWRHRNIQALALRTNCGETGIGDVCADVETEVGTTCWPRLRALYLRRVDQYWLQKLPMFEKLQVVELRDIRSPLPDFVNDLAHSISRCRWLQVLELEFLEEVDHSDIFLTMAEGCPLLRRFDMRTCDSDPEMTGDQFSRLLRALPRVELLSLSVRLRMTASKLRDLAKYCSRLKVLELDQARLFLSLQSLVQTPSLSGLRELRLRSVWFRNPRRYTRLRSLQCIASEWSRVFPRMRRCPCSLDVYGPDVQLKEDTSSWELDGDDGDWSTRDDSEVSLGDPRMDQDFDEYDSEHTSSEESEGDDGDWSTDDDSKVTSADPGGNLDFDEYDSDWYRLRRRLWKLLDYDMDNCSEVIDATNHMWQTNFEIEMFDWPIVPMQAFVDPRTHSSAEAAGGLDLTTNAA